MTVNRTRVEFDSLADVKIAGMVEGHSVEYTGKIDAVEVEVDDGLDPELFSWRNATYSTDKTTYVLKLVIEDNKALSLKVGKKKVRHAASTYFTSTKNVDMLREECGAPQGADYDIDYDSMNIEFTWEVEVD